MEQKTIGKIGKIPINIKSKCFPYWTSDENDFDKDLFFYVGTEYKKKNHFLHEQRVQKRQISSIKQDEVSI